MNKVSRELIKAAIEWERARERHTAKPSAKRMEIEFLAQLALLEAIRKFRGGK